jgi:hypothetical protein
MSKHVVEKKVDKTAAKAKVKRSKQEKYERPETVKVGKAKEVTQGTGTKDLDGYYGPGWTRYW